MVKSLNSMKGMALLNEVGNVIEWFCDRPMALASDFVPGRLGFDNEMIYKIYDIVFRSPSELCLPLFICSPEDFMTSAVVDSPNLGVEHTVGMQGWLYEENDCYHTFLSKNSGRVLVEGPYREVLHETKKSPDDFFVSWLLGTLVRSIWCFPTRWTCFEVGLEMNSDVERIENALVPFWRSSFVHTEFSDGVPVSKALDDNYWYVSDNQSFILSKNWESRVVLYDASHLDEFEIAMLSHFVEL